MAARQEVIRGREESPFLGWSVLGRLLGIPRSFSKGSFFAAFVVSRGAEGALFKHGRRGRTAARNPVFNLRYQFSFFLFFFSLALARSELGLDLRDDINEQCDRYFSNSVHCARETIASLTFKLMEIRN